MYYQDVFERVETKYLLSAKQYRLLLGMLQNCTQPDKFPQSSIMSLYFDTPDRRMIQTSLEKPVYKEKLRLRSYGVPAADGTVFPEIKKKYKGVVYKRRTDMTCSQAMAYLSGESPAPVHNAVTGEIDWLRRRWGELVPAMVLSYERTALVGVEDPGLRITFDSRILWRDEALSLTEGVWGEPLLRGGERLLELKLLRAMPLWLARMLGEIEAYPVSFSKYGSGYLASLKRTEKTTREAEVCA